MFKPNFYRSNGPDIGARPPLAHYVEIGAREGRSPKRLFDPPWYAARHGLPIEESLWHYLKHGVGRGDDPHPLFSVGYYRTVSDCGPDEEPITHYRRKAQAGEAVAPTPFFSAEFYRRMYPDVAVAGVDPFLHYLMSGWQEGRMPSPYFHPRWYLSCYGDVVEAGVEPLGHFISIGAFEGRRPHYLIDLDYYRLGNPDVEGSDVDLYNHFISYGDREGRSAHLLFKPNFYRSNGPDIGARPPLAHYVEIGAREGRSPCPAFDAKHYSTIYPHEQIEPMLHYLLADKATRPHFHPLIDGGFQRLTSRRAEQDICPLIDFTAFLSHFHAGDIARAATSMPAPRRALIAKPSSAALLPQDRQPKVSVVIPCYKSDAGYLEACVGSVIAQGYVNWELILADDGSPDRQTWPALQDLAKRDGRIKAVHFDKNGGISNATNAAIAHATGDYLALVDHDDVLTPNALEEMLARMIAENADAAYSDQAYLTADGRIESVFLKPNWSPTLFAGVMYVGHLLIVRRETALAAGLFKPEFDGCQDYEFMLRVSEVTTKILHVPEVLYYWRRAEGSVASNSDAKGKIEPKQAKAVTEHFLRLGFRGTPTIETRVPHRLRIRPATSHRPLVDIVLQGPVSVAVRKAAIERLSTTRIDIASTRMTAADESPATVVAAGNAPWILFMDADLRFRKPEWIDYLVMHAERSDVAFVAPHIYRPDGLVVSAGLVVSKTGTLLKAYSGAREGEDGEAGSLICDREVSAVGSHCSLIRRGALDRLGGLSPKFFGVEHAVNEASLRATDRGLRNIAVASFIVELPKTADFSSLIAAIDQQIFVETNEGRFTRGDRYYNANYAPGSADFRVG